MTSEITNSADDGVNTNPLKIPDINEAIKNLDIPDWVKSGLRAVRENRTQSWFEVRPKNPRIQPGIEEAQEDCEEFLRDLSSNQTIDLLTDPPNPQAAHGMVIGMQKVARQYPELFKCIKEFTCRTLRSSDPKKQQPMGLLRLFNREFCLNAGITSERHAIEAVYKRFGDLAALLILADPQLCARFALISDQRDGVKAIREISESLTESLMGGSKYRSNKELVDFIKETFGNPAIVNDGNNDHRLSPKQRLKNF